MWIVTKHFHLTTELPVTGKPKDSLDDVFYEVVYTENVLLIDVAILSEIGD